jgi:hypothetical protein
VWRKVEVALVEQQTGKAREGLVGGREVWRLRAQSLSWIRWKSGWRLTLPSRTRPSEIWKELQEKAREILSRKIKDKAGRLPHWWLLFATTLDDN